MLVTLSLFLALQGAVIPPGPSQAAAAGQLSQAEARYRTAIAATPGIAAYHESLALVLEREGRMEEAIASHREAVRLDSAESRNRAGLGAALLRVGRDVEAVSELQAASRLDRSSVEVRKQLAAALLKQSRNAEALAVLREAQRLDSTDRDVGRAIALVNHEPMPAEAPVAAPSRTGATVRTLIEVVFGVVVVAAGLVLLAPLGAALLLAVVQVPRQWRATRRAAA